MSTATSNRMVELGIDKMSVEERIDLEQDLWECIHSIDPVPGMMTERREERRRLDAEMGITPQKIISNMIIELGIDKLSILEYIDLAHDILEDLGDNRPMPAMTPELRELLDRRSAEMKANPEICLTWEQIRSSIESNRSPRS